MSSLRVLVVDDEPAICQAFSALLACYGFDVHTVHTDNAAYDFLAQHRIDALVLDLRLRDSAPGDAIFREATRRDPSLRGRTMFMTGDISEEARARIGACGCPYLMKPFDAQLLVDAVAALCGGGAGAPPAAAPLGEQPGLPGSIVAA